MLEQQKDVFYYITMTNANYPQPSFNLEHAESVVRGGYLLKAEGQGEPCTLLASGAVMTEALQAFDRLINNGRRVYLFSITSYCELARQSVGQEDSHLSALLAQSRGPIVAVSDWVRAVPDQIRAHLPASRSFEVLGTDGFGCSDTRAALRERFGVDAKAIVAAFNRID